MPTKDPKRQAAGRRSRNKGKEFERQIARDLRAIYDPPELVKAIDEAGNCDRKRVMSVSRVRRGEQGNNAHEPDVVAPCEWWLELQTGNAKTPEQKLEQAQRDLTIHLGRADRPRWTRCVAICHELAARKITATMTMADLIGGCGGEPPRASTWIQNLSVTIRYEDFLHILRTRENHERREREAAWSACRAGRPAC